jgi:hypothetical protein
MAVFLIVFFLVRGVGACTLFSGLQTDLQGAQVLCEECGFSGYLNDGGECVCLTPAMDPGAQCLALGIRNETLLKVWQYYEAPCECHTSFQDGFFRLTEPERTKIINGSIEYQWGDGPPPTCSLCFNPYYGPAPALQTYSSRQNDIPIACGMFGGQDPVLLLETPAPTPSGDTGVVRRLDEQFQWSLCAGHGKWNPEFHGCECEEGWGLEEVSGAGFNGSFLAICQICQGPWGPLVPSQQNSLQNNSILLEEPYCGVIWTPDPLDGVLKECSGHGSYFDGGCVCDFSNDLGFWILQQFQQNQSTLLLVGVEQYQRVNITYTVETCQQCYVTGDTPPCLQTLSPTDQPTLSPN